MSRMTLIEHMKDDIVGALREKDWEGVERAAEQLKSLLIEAVIDNSPDHITTIRAIFADLRAEVNIRYRLQTKLSPEWMSAMLLADQSTAALAGRARPRPTPATYEAPVLSARHRILLVLGKASAVGLAGKAVASEAGLADETVSRALDRLESEGLVERERQGKKILNRITAAGRKTLCEERRKAMRIPANQIIHPELANVDSVFQDMAQTAPLNASRRLFERVSETLRATPISPLGLADIKSMREDRMRAAAGFASIDGYWAPETKANLQRLDLGRARNDCLHIDDLRNPPEGLALINEELPNRLLVAA